jgi:hypothetical protein
MARAEIAQAWKQNSAVTGGGNRYTNDCRRADSSTTMNANADPYRSSRRGALG